MKNTTRAEPGTVGKYEALPKIPTGITGFDEVLEGGMPEGRCILVAGGPGTGKTMLLNEFLYRGATCFDEPGVFVSFEEMIPDIHRNCRTLGWDIERLTTEGKLRFVDFSPGPEEITIIGDFDLDPIFAVIEHAVRSTGAKRVVIDSIGSLFIRLPAEYAIRGLFFQLIRRLKELGVTSLFSAEIKNNMKGRANFGIEEFVADGIVELFTNRGQGSLNRYIQVRKMRGAGYRGGRVRFTISEYGMTVYPKIPLDSGVATTDFSKRLSTGVAGLDAAMKGGIPQGHVVLVAGNTGSGKTTLAMHFAEAGLEKGEKVAWLALEEPVTQIEKTALTHGWDFTERRGKGDLHFISSPLLDIVPDKLLYEIITTFEKTGAKRLILDSVSSLESSVLNKEEVREFLIQVAGLCKARGITCIMNYLIADSFGAQGGQLLGSLATNELRLSSIVDGVVLLRYVERDQGVKKLLTVLKLRGSDHEKGILSYEIGHDGVRLGERFTI